MGLVNRSRLYLPITHILTIMNIADVNVTVMSLQMERTRLSSEQLLLPLVFKMGAKSMIILNDVIVNTDCQSLKSQVMLLNQNGTEASVQVLYAYLLQCL